MQVTLGYLGTSGLSDGALRFSPNLSRPPVFFDAELKKPLRYREAMSALHDVVVGDLVFRKKDRSAYEAWKKAEAEAIAQRNQQLYRDAKAAELAALGKQAPPADLEPKFRKMHALYWTARRKWAAELSRNDPEMFRHLVPCDPVVTVAPDTVYFECFSKDESSYGCLSVARDAFTADRAHGLGTTNVDYSLGLYDHFQTLRTYRPTRLLVDPSGFGVVVASQPDYREEKIDLPPTWLRGFGQLQASMTLPATTVRLSVETVYAILAHLKRHREKTGPRSLRFRLVPGKTPVIVLDPWGLEIAERVHTWDGPAPQEIKVWGRRRLMPLARTLPLAERVDVRLLGSGLPSVWVARLGELNFTLALSGWTANDWTRGGALEFLGSERRPNAKAIAAVSAELSRVHQAPLGELTRAVGSTEDTETALYELAKRGQVVFDFAHGVHRWRQVMPEVLSEAVIGPEPEEVREGRKLAREGQVKVERSTTITAERTLVVAKVDGTSCEAIFDADGAFSKAKCSCRHFYKFRLRAGPCRHLLALRLGRGHA